jgi:hypothetical protein
MIAKIPLTLLGLALGFTVAVGGAGDVENIVAPIASPSTLVITKAENNELCWTLKFTKLREATPVFFSWQIETLDGDKIYLAPYPPSYPEQQRTVARVTRKGDSSGVSNCTYFNPEQTGPSFTIKAYASYKTHGYWEVPRYIGPFKVVNYRVTNNKELDSASKD